MRTSGGDGGAARGARPAHGIRQDGNLARRDPAGRDRASGLDHRPQRSGQVDGVQGAVRALTRSARADPLRRRGRDESATGRTAAPGHGLRPAGAERVSPDDRGGEPAARGLHPTALGRAGSRGRARVRDVPELRESRRKRAADLSGGQQQMLEMARSLLLRPRLLLLDEPTLGLAPLVFKEVFRIIDELRRSGQTILMVEQNAAKALEISDYAYVLDLGRNRYEGPGPRRSATTSASSACILGADRRRVSARPGRDPAGASRASGSPPGRRGRPARPWPRRTGARRAARPRGARRRSRTAR